MTQCSRAGERYAGLSLAPRLRQKKTALTWAYAGGWGLGGPARGGVPAASPAPRGARGARRVRTGGRIAQHVASPPGRGCSRLRACPPSWWPRSLGREPQRPRVGDARRDPLLGEDDQVLLQEHGRVGVGGHHARAADRPELNRPRRGCRPAWYRRGARPRPGSRSRPAPGQVRDPADRGEVLRAQDDGQSPPYPCAVSSPDGGQHGRRRRARRRRP